MEKVKKLSVGTVFGKIYEFENVAIEKKKSWGGIPGRDGLNITTETYIGAKGEVNLDTASGEYTFIADEAIIFLQIIPE